jgi:hypothetical protein
MCLLRPDCGCVQVSKTINGTPMYMYEITSDKRNYLSTIGKKGKQGARVRVSLAGTGSATMVAAIACTAAHKGSAQLE